MSRTACIVSVKDLRVGDRIVDEVKEQILPPLAFKDDEHGLVVDEEGNRYTFDTRTVIVLR